MKSANPNPVRHVVSSREMLALATFATATAAHAQSQPAPAASGERKKNDGDVLTDLVVSADQERTYNPEKLSSNKLPAPLLDTPQTFSVVPKEVFNQQNAQNLTDVLKNTPGISFNAGENGFGSGMSNFSMRGVDTAGSVFIDGVRDSGNYMRDVFNTERVEIGKGPAADNGRGTAGGYVNIVTKTPQLTDFYSGTASYTFDEYAGAGNFRTTLDINQSVPGLEGTAVRLNALFQEGGVPGRKWAESNAWGVAPSISFGLGTPTRFTLAYQHVEQNLIPDWGVPGAFVKGTVNYDSSIGGRSNRDNFYGLKSDYDDIVSDSLLALFEHDFANGLKFTNQTRWAKTDRESIYTVPFGYNDTRHPETTGKVTTQQQGYGRENTSISNLTNLLYEFQTGSIKHTLSAGLEYSWEKSEADRYGTTATGTATVPPPPEFIADPHHPDAGRASGNYIGAPTEFAKVEIDSVGVYLYDTIEFNPQWQLTGGLRYDYYDLTLRSTDAAGAQIGAANYSKTESTLGGKVGLVFKPAENGSIYASAGLSYLPPGSFLSNPDISRTGDNAFPGAGAGLNSKDSRNQKNLNYEIGTKWDFCDGRLSATAAIFRTERQDVAITGTSHVGGVPDGGGLVTGYHEQIIQGIELGLAGKVTDEWSIFGGLLLMESERKVGSYWETARRLAQAGDYNAAYNSFDGDELAFTPNYSANLWTTYRFDSGLTIGGGLQYVSSSYLGRPDDAERIIPNGRFGKLPDYIVFNALVQYELSENATIRLNVDNVFDEVYAVSANWGGTRMMLGNPRTFTVSADWRF